MSIAQGIALDNEGQQEAVRFGQPAVVVAVEGKAVPRPRGGKAMQRDAAR